MPLIVSDVTMQFGARVLFDKVNLKFSDGNRYGLIGANGCGKSTFMKILGSDIEASVGSVVLGDGERLGKLRQDHAAFENERVVDVVLQGHEELWSVLRRKSDIYNNPDASDEDYVLAGDLETQFFELDGYTAESRASDLLLGVGVPLDMHDQLMSILPSGLKIRVLLAQVLFFDPDILLLDEPTNNLDIYTISWLVDVLNEKKSTMIIISHDRHFLNSVCTHMADIDYGSVSIYAGNYDEYMESSALARQRVVDANAKAKDKIVHLQDFVRRFSANKSKSRQATSRLKQIDKIKVEDVKPSSRQHPFIRFDEDKRLYRNVLRLLSLGHSYNESLFTGMSGHIAAGERIAIIGHNGVGKSTLLKILANIVSPTTGELQWAEHAQLGYYPQHHTELFEKNCDLTEWLTHFKKNGEDDQIVRSTLGRLLFSGHEVTKEVNVLSGGEKGRMVYGSLMLQRPNVLLMDEPTNHMDMETIESLSISLEKYEGTLVFVSNDRQFVSSLATRIWEIRDNGIVDFLGNYEDYLLVRHP